MPCHCSQPTDIWNTLSGVCTEGCLGRWTGASGRCDIGIELKVLVNERVELYFKIFLQRLHSTIFYVSVYASQS